MTDALVASGVGFSVGEKALLRDVDVTVAPGKLVGVIGPNGAGKTTLLRLLSGELRPSAGHVSLGGTPLPDLPRRERARRLAVLPQQSSLAFPMTALEVVLLGRAPHVLRSRESKDDFAIALDALEATEAVHLADRRYPSLSGGEKSRVQTARVLAQIWHSSRETPCHLLLDEPTAALDIAHQHTLLEYSREFARTRHTGVLAILHDLNLASQYADEILVLNGGRTVGNGPPAEVLNPALLRKAFAFETLVLEHPTHGWPLVVSR
jgi:iron complex transport system ATP-binding protein